MNEILKSILKGIVFLLFFFSIILILTLILVGCEFNPYTQNCLEYKECRGKSGFTGRGNYLDRIYFARCAYETPCNGSQDYTWGKFESTQKCYNFFKDTKVCTRYEWK